MSNIRSNISKKSKYWIPKERYLELKYFCLQYPQWEQEMRNLIPLNSPDTTMNIQTMEAHPTEIFIEMVESINSRMQLVRDCARKATSLYPELQDYILAGVTKGLSYTYLNTKLLMPFSKNQYYSAYRKFFWVLSNTKN